MDSALGKGSVFRVFIPRSDALSEEEHERAGDSSVKGEAGSAARVLFVDDEKALARLGLRYLERHGYCVEACTDSCTALERFQAQPHHFDIIVTDQIMPGMTGLELAKKALQIRENIPIILCSGYSERITEAELSSSGVQRYLRKPITDAALVKAIQGVLKDAAWRGN